MALDGVGNLVSTSSLDLLLAAELIDGRRGFAAADGPIILTSLEHGGSVELAPRFVSCSFCLIGKTRT